MDINLSGLFLKKMKKSMNQCLWAVIENSICIDIIPINKYTVMNNQCSNLINVL